MTLRPLVLALSLLPALAAAGPENSLRPQARQEAAVATAPEDGDPKPEIASVAKGGDAANGEDEATGSEVQSVKVSEVPLPPPVREELDLSEAEQAACLAVLDLMRVTYTVSEPVIPGDDRDCGILRPVTVTEVAPGVALSPPATLRCPAAQALALWVRDFVQPAAARLSERGALTAIRNGSDYVCRRRNNATEGKLSEHAFGNALDVMGFDFSEGPNIPVEPREAQGSMAEAFQDAVRASACMEFTTVLGPGSNAAHDNHLHLDVIRRTRGWRLCEQGPGPEG
ncbi:extensin family protein [Sagittula salina]|uniref:Extensin family protein n=1 Tax=Sagittula salina TaxID=2820268 RepID=A0A940RZR3_9RHOB|nr:extensin family protein [Sagittula salina]MBP0481262.1 extensin family protein [Sagittula salina]